MNKNNIPYVLLLSFGFLGFILGGFFLIFGSLVSKEEILYVGIIALLSGVIFYVIFGILLLIRYLRKKGEASDK